MIPHGTRVIGTSKHDWRSEFKRLDGAYAPSTMRNYRSDVEAFEAWCVAIGRIAFPATVATVCEFLEDQGRQRAPASVRRRLYAIRKVHALLRLPDPTSDEEINLTFRRINRRNAIRPKQAKKDIAKRSKRAIIAV